MNTSSKKVGCAVMLFVASIAVPQWLGASQLFGRESDFQELVAARSLKCSFPWYASVDWDSDAPNIKSARQEDFGFQIDGIDHRRRTARIIGNAGAEDLAGFRGADSVSFVEQVAAGTLNVTTVYAWRDKQGRFKS